MSCSEKEKDTPFRVSPPNYNYAHGFFPSKDGYTWMYTLTQLDKNRDTLSTTALVATYDTSISSLVYQGAGVNSSANWYNSGNRLLCCSGYKLIDYTKLDCSGDSVLIRSENNGTGTQAAFVEIYQHCDKQTLMDLPGYEDKTVIKTLQINSINTGAKLVIERYYGHGVGMLRETQRMYDLDENLTNIEIKSLQSHQF